MNRPVKVVPREEPDLEAWQVTDQNIAAIAAWCRADGYWGPETPEPCVWLDCRAAKVGDFVVRGATGHFFVRRAEEFHRDYVEEGAA